MPMQYTKPVVGNALRVKARKVHIGVESGWRSKNRGVIDAHKVTFQNSYTLTNIQGSVLALACPNDPKKPKRAADGLFVVLDGLNAFIAHNEIFDEYCEDKTAEELVAAGICEAYAKDLVEGFCVRTMHFVSDTDKKCYFSAIHDEENDTMLYTSPKDWWLHSSSRFGKWTKMGAMKR